MPDTTTPLLNIVKPAVGVKDPAKQWGYKINENFDKIDVFGLEHEISGAHKSGIISHSSLIGLTNYDDHTQYLPRDGSRGMSNALDMGGFGISNLCNPVGLLDAVTKDYVDSSGGTESQGFISYWEGSYDELFYLPVKSYGVLYRVMEQNQYYVKDLNESGGVRAVF